MKITKGQFEKIKNYSYSCIKNNDSNHQIEHINQTVLLGKALAKKEKADIKKIEIICLLHDISKFEQTKNQDHGTLGSKKAKKFLEKIKLNKKDIEEICYAIEQHNKGKLKKTKEANIIWDADKLQAIGAYGILRCHEYNILFKKMNQKESFNSLLEEIKFFQKRFRTKTGRKIAKKSLKFLKKFEKDYLKIQNAEI